MEASKISVIGIGRLEALELQQQLEGHANIVQTEGIPPDKQGDTAVLDLVIQFGPYAIGILGLWLLKPRKGKKMKQTIKITATDGSSREETIYFHETSSESPSEVVVNALSNLTGLGKHNILSQINNARENQES